MWKANPASPLYDYKLLQARLDRSNELLASGTPSEIIFFLRSGAIRSLGGLCHPTLLKYCATGTKTLIEDYVEGVIKLLKRLDGFSPPPPPVFRPSESAMAAAFSDPEDEQTRMGLDQRVKTNFYGEMLQSFGRTALVLHGGASFGVCHLGVAKALHAQGLLPKIVCGSYIGALVASHICVQPPEHLAEALTGAKADLSAFRRIGPHSLSFRRKAVRFLKYGHVFDVRVLEEAAKASIGPDVTFREAFRTSGRILNIVVYSRGEMPVLLNYLTTPDVLVWTAACASCAIPGLYEEVMLLRKDEKGDIGPWNPSAIRLQAATVVQYR
jgi:TAG lipase/lysophosphatidylethanolamine acyltransferase